MRCLATTTTTRACTGRPNLRVLVPATTLWPTRATDTRNLSEAERSGSAQFAVRVNYRQANRGAKDGVGVWTGQRLAARAYSDLAD